MLLKSSFNTTHDHTRVLKHRKQSQYSGWLFLATHSMAQLLLP
jgi:hypothetical protein